MIAAVAALMVVVWVCLKVATHVTGPWRGLAVAVALEATVIVVALLLIPGLRR